MKRYLVCITIIAVFLLFISCSTGDKNMPQSAGGKNIEAAPSGTRSPGNAEGNNTGDSKATDAVDNN